MKKRYNGVEYDTDLDYTGLIRQAADSGDPAAAARYEQARNAKIAGEGLPYAATNDYAAWLPGATGASMDFMALINEAVRSGDLAAAARYEQQRNRKIRDQGLTYPETSQFTDWLPENRYRFDPEQDADYAAAKTRMDRAFEAFTRSADFRYDPETDPVYAAYAARYRTEGRAAMEDTLGRAAALTGGYGSTYAESAAQQAYGTYLSRLNDVLPELYGAAYKRHRDAQSDRATEYAYARASADKAYDRAYAQWSGRLQLSRADEASTAARYAAADKAAAEAAETAKRDADSAAADAKKDAESAQKNQTTAKNNLANMIFKTGYTPTDAELAAAGMTRAEAEAWKQAYYTNLWT